MVLTYGEGLYGNGAGVVTPLDHRMAQITGFTKTTTPNLIRPGLLYNGTATIVSGTSGMSYDVAPFSAVSTRGATQGAVPFANDAIANVVTTAAPGSNSRYDVVYAWPRDYAIDGVDSVPVLGVEQGTAAASPTVPSLSAYPGAIELARILVPAGVTGTDSGTTITQTSPFTSVDGGLVPFRTTTEMNLWTTALTGQLALDLSDGATYRWDGSAWAVPPVQGQVPSSVVVGSGSVSVADDGTVEFTGASSVSLNDVFTDDYLNYQMFWNIDSASVASRVNFRFRAAGVDDTTGYKGSYAEAATSWVVDGSVTSEVRFGRIATTGGAGEATFFAPAVASSMTRMRGGGTDSDGVLSVAGATRTTAKAHDGLTILGSGGSTLTGTVKVVKAS